MGSCWSSRQSIRWSAKNAAELEVPLPFAYDPPEFECRFTNRKEPDALQPNQSSASIGPRKLIRFSEARKASARLLQDMPPLDTGNLWQVQIDSINNLEKSLALNKPVP